jgi:hypothetical protein
MLWTQDKAFHSVSYASEADLEKTILELRARLFGPRRIFLDVKKKIGIKGGVRSIPDGYLIDLNTSEPRLYVVEVELREHDYLRHIAVQILQFSLSAESERIRIKNILSASLHETPAELGICQQYATAHAYNSVDHLLEHLVFEAPFTALVIIDAATDELQDVLTKRFSFGVEVLEIGRFEDASGNRIYQFEPFLADVEEDVAAVQLGDLGALDTVVVPAQEDGFNKVFLGEHRWYAIRMHASMRPQIKFIAAYQVAPISAITHIAPVASIDTWKDSGKLVITFAEPAHKVGPISLVNNGKVSQLQNLRYTSRQRIETAKTLDDIWGRQAPPN